MKHFEMMVNINTLQIAYLSRLVAKQQIRFFEPIA